MGSILHIISSRNKLAVIFSIVVSLNHIGFIPTMAPYYAAVLSFICIFSIINHSNYSVENRSFLFLSFLPITILLSQPDPVFQSWLRLASYSAFFAIGSPLFQSDYARQFRRDSFITICCICVFIGVGSFFAYFLGYSAQAERAIEEGIDTNLYDVGRFSGIAKHSMSLGPLAGIGAMFFAYQAIITKKKRFYLGTISCIGSVMFAASRGAFIATLASALYLLYKFSASKAKFVRYILNVCICGILTFPIWGPAMDGLETKQASHNDDTELFDSRSEKFGYRIQEFASSPIWGVGFAAIDPQFGDKYIRTKGIIEPGSSWLAIFSMTGLIGFIFFFRMYKRSFDIMNRSKEQISALLVSVFILVSVHMLVEGYIFATGNPLCYYVILFIGRGYDMLYNDDKI